MKFNKTILMLLAVGVVAFATTSCTEEEPYVPEWEWGEGSGGGNTENPDEGGNTENPGGGNTENPDDGDNTDTPVDPADLKPRFLWIDAAANFEDYANDQEQIAADLARVAETGFTDIIVDIRPTMGDVLFQTTHIEQVKKLSSWSGGLHWEERTATWDYLQAFIDAGHEVGLKVHAGFNTMACGNDSLYGLEAQGMVYRDSSKHDWVTVLNTPTGMQSMMDLSAYGTKFLNPANDEVVEFLCNLLKDLAAYEDLDGIILDRCRYDDMYCDFSDISRQKFEEYIGSEVENFPGDILTASLNEENKWTYTQGKHFKMWLEFRAKTIHDFIVEAEAAVRSVNSDISFGAYVGGWYSSYYDMGVNWASPNYAVSSHYPWATLGYKDYGYADHLDVLLIGAYASTSSIYGAGEWSVQGFCKLAHEKVMGDCLVAGGPDIGNPTGWPDGGKSAQVTQTVDAAINACDGYFCFDLIHVKMYNYWNALKKGIDNYIKANK
ncbi:MAG: family 10 glycosylhydrolase [Tidjanibacter sp.]|nr:family 10 glycosylhydrolase [Tidjanibacter sp.]